MWPGFDGKPYSRDEWTAHVDSISVDQLRWCKFITLHNTSAPTLKQWAESGPAHDARIRNLESYYENDLGWHAGPHAFISRSYINGFSDLTKPGVHASCFNRVSIGLEMVGEYDIEEFTSGDGAMVAEMAVHAMAVLHLHIGIRPDGFQYGVKGLHFHIECKRDNHDCPGTKARDKPALIARILSRMDELDHGVIAAPPIPPSPRTPSTDVPTRFSNILATEFGGRGDRQESAYGGMVNGNQPQVSLPARLASDRRLVRVFHSDKQVEAKVNDVGPWNRHDAYWEKTDGRPLVETQFHDRTKAQNGLVPSNEAGIDMTPAVFEALGIPNVGKALVDWEFV